MIQIGISKNANEALIRLLKQDKTKYIRLNFLGVGWKGTSLEVTLDELREGDGKISIDGIDVIFEKQHKLYVHKSEIDYDPKFPGNGFQVTPWFNGF